MSIAWYEYLSTIGLAVIVLTFVYIFAERRTGGKPDWGSAVCLFIGILLQLPEAWIESHRFTLLGTGAAIGTGAMALILERDRRRERARSEGEL